MKFDDIELVLKPRQSHDEDWEGVVRGWSTDHRGIRVDLQPDFQRKYVWTDTQQASYIENMLRGFPSGHDIYFNHPTWGDFTDAEKYPLVCLDGQQRIGAVVAFMNNKLPIFGGHLYKDIEGYLPWTDRAYFTIHVCNLKTKYDVVLAYRELNFAGVAHEEEEAEYIQELMEKYSIGGIETLEG